MSVAGGVLSSPAIFTYLSAKRSKVFASAVVNLPEPLTKNHVSMLKPSLPALSLSCKTARIAPSLMLPSTLDDSGDLVYQFYSPIDKKITMVSKHKRNGNSDSESDQNLPSDDSKVVGSSHGWLALFNPGTNDLFLSNPVTGVHIKLPPVDKLPDPQFNMIAGCASVTKVSLSCSPDKQDDCRAMMTFGPADRLAFCVPGRSSEWTPIGDLFYNYEDEGLPYSACWAFEDFVYRSRRGFFSCVTGRLEFYLEPLHRLKVEGFIAKQEDCDITDPLSPKIVDCGLELEDIGHEDGIDPSCWHVDFLEKCCIQIPQLVYHQQSDRLFLVVRFLLPRVGPDGLPYGQFPLDGRSVRGLFDVFRRRTVTFFVLEMKPQGYMQLVRSLDDLVMFVGVGDSIAVSASEFPELKPNSIYFADGRRFLRSPSERPSYGSNHDVGIFDYGSKSILPLYDPSQIQLFNGIQSPALWFTPTQGVCTGRFRPGSAQNRPNRQTDGLKKFGPSRGRQAAWTEPKPAETGRSVFGRFGPNRGQLSFSCAVDFPMLCLCFNSYIQLLQICIHSSIPSLPLTHTAILYFFCAGAVEAEGGGLLFRWRRRMTIVTEEGGECL